MIVLNFLLYLAALFSWLGSAPIWVPFVLLLLAVLLTAVLSGLDLNDLFDIF